MIVYVPLTIAMMVCVFIPQLIVMIMMHALLTAVLLALDVFIPRKLVMMVMNVLSTLAFSVLGV